MFLLIIALLCCWGADLFFKYHHKDRRCTKPFLIPLIMAVYISACLRFHIPIRGIELAALGLGWVGDIFLMREDDHAFLVGLIAFLAGHVMYFVLFMMLHVPAISASSLVAMLFYLGYATYFYHSLRGNMDVRWHRPVIFYIVIISMMSLCACLLYGDVSLQAWLCLWLGSVFFVLSDSLVAWEKFVEPDIHGVMETYVAAQILIMIGVLLIG